MIFLQDIKDKIRITLKVVSPRYDQLTLYLYGISFLLLFFVDSDFSTVIMNLEVGAVFLFVGAFYSIFNVAVRKDALGKDKKYIIMFLVISNLIIAGFYFRSFVISDTPIIIWKTIPVIYNMVYALFLIILSKFDALDESNIVYNIVTGKQILIVTTTLIISFLCNEFVLRSQWIYTYSWSIFLSNTVKDIVVYYFPSSKISISPTQ